MNLKIDVYTLCYNEIKLAPFVVQYWQRYANKVVVYDNGSTDGSIEFLQRFPFIEIRHFETDGLNDEVHMNLKNNVWKESCGSADFVVVCDFDECLFSLDLMKELSYMKENGMTICRPTEYLMLSDRFPEYDESKMSYQIIGTGYRGGSKYILFDPNKIAEINYLPGAHVCRPVGKVKEYDGNKIFTLHHAEMCLDYVLKKYESRINHMSSTNKKYGYGSFYYTPKEKVIKDIGDKLKNAEDLISIVGQ